MTSWKVSGLRRVMHIVKVWLLFEACGIFLVSNRNHQAWNVWCLCLMISKDLITSRTSITDKLKWDFRAYVVCKICKKWQVSPAICLSLLMFLSSIGLLFFINQRISFKSLQSITWLKSWSLILHNYMQSLYGAFIKAGNHEGATFQKFNLLHPYFSMHLLHTVLYTFPKELPRRICLTIKTSWPICLIQGWYSKEKWDSSHSSGLKG